MTEKKKKPVYDVIWDSFSSLKMAITLLILLIILSFFAIYLQEKFPPQYTLEYWRTVLSEQEFSFFNVLGFFDPYHSFWYFIVLILLSLNVLVCTLTRIKPIWSIITKKSFKKTPSVIKQSDINREILLKKDYREIKEKIEGLFRKHGYSYTKAEGEEKPVFYLSKKGWSRYGFIMTHIGLLVILLGGIIGNRFGFKTYRYANPGTVIDAPRKDYKVRIDDFEIIRNERGAIKDWLTTVTVIENDREILSKVIEVNHPLSYKGLNFYQSDYGLNSGELKSARILITFPDMPDSQKILDIPLHERRDLGYDNLSVEADDFLPHFAMRSGKQAFSASNKPNNPALRIAVYRNDELINYNWIFLNYPDMQHMKEIPVRIKFISFNGINQTGLQITGNPGSPFLLVGFFIMSLGVCLSLLVSHRRLWGVIEKDEKGKLWLFLGGSTNKNKLGMESEMNKIKNELNTL